MYYDVPFGLDNETREMIELKVIAEYEKIAEQS